LRGTAFKAAILLKKQQLRGMACNFMSRQCLRQEDHLPGISWVGLTFKFDYQHGSIIAIRKALICFPTSLNSTNLQSHHWSNKNMKYNQRLSGPALALATLLSAIPLGVMADDKIKDAKPALSGKDAIETRRSAYNLIGKSFKPIGGILKGEVDYNSVDVGELVKRIVFLSGFLHDAFPEDSNLGEPQTKAKPELWQNKEDFKKRLKEFKANADNLLVVSAREKSASGAFKEAAQKVAQDCKGCHDNYKVK
jgi:cytochrome c556